MKRSARYLYPHPVVRKTRRPWRAALTALGVAVAAGVFFLRIDGGEIAPPELPVAAAGVFPAAGMEEPVGGIAGGPAEGIAEEGPEELIVQNLPAPDEGAFFSGEMEALAVAAAEAPEPSLLSLATVGEAVSFLPAWPFLIFSAGERALPLDGGAAELLSAPEGISAADFVGPPYDGPRFYAENERYTVETDDAGLQVLCSSVAKGDTAGVILNEWLGASEVAALIAAADPIHSLAGIHEGRPFSIVRQPESGEFVRFTYEMDKFRRLSVSRQDGVFIAVEEAIEYETRLGHVRGTIDSSLFEAVAESGEGPMLAVKLADVFSCEVDFLRELRVGDSFEALVEKMYRDGEFAAYGRMLAARFVNRGKMFEAYLFADGKGRLHYYNAAGEALQKTLLKAPLAYNRVSSGYSMNRRHPILGYSRPHQGVDYAAPAGTPVKAVGDGVVIRAGWGGGYGNMIVIRHAGGLESQYAHLSGYARGIKAGVQVSQGQTVGYVGATGLATGPHLDFRLRQNGKFLDPAKIIVPREAPVSGDRMDEFRSAASYMAGETALAGYVPVEWPQ